MIGLYETGINGILADEMVSLNQVLICFLGSWKNSSSNFSACLSARIQGCQKLLPCHSAKSCNSTLEEGIQEMVSWYQSSQPDRNKGWKGRNPQKWFLAREVRCVSDNIWGCTHLYDTSPEIQMGIYYCGWSAQNQEWRKYNFKEPPKAWFKI